MCTAGPSAGVVTDGTSPVDGLELDYTAPGEVSVRWNNFTDDCAPIESYSTELQRRIGSTWDPRSMSSVDMQWEAGASSIAPCCNANITVSGAGNFRVEVCAGASYPLTHYSCWPCEEFHRSQQTCMFYAQNSPDLARLLFAILTGPTLIDKPIVPVKLMHTWAGGKVHIAPYCVRTEVSWLACVACGRCAPMLGVAYETKRDDVSVSPIY